MEQKGWGRAAVAFVMLDTETLKMLTCWQGRGREDRSFAGENDTKLFSDI